MEDLQLLFCIFSLFAGVASITLAVFIYITHPKKALKYFIGLDASLFMIQTMIALNLYIVRTQHVGTFLVIISNAMDVLGTSFSSFFGLLMIHELLGKCITKMKRNIILTISAFQIVIITICYTNTKLVILKHIGQISVIAVILYETLIAIINYHQIPEQELKRASRIFAAITLAFIPFFILEYIREGIEVISYFQFLKMFALPAYFFVINACTLFWVCTYFNTPAYFAQDKLTGYFIEKYAITDKETEIIELSLKGLTYKQIAERIFVSPKTVDNHVQNIYKKLGVTNKIQLSNLIHSKEK
ncbi:MAG TPA: helix-turn-helix transcriptional regulator [Oscillospiraceae bacterium]|nr:helix-turn-helix transcriptional regulator [Oscillospiraceae bacterium]